MCIICIEFEKEKLNLSEAWRNYSEMSESLPPEHAAEVEDMLWNEAFSKSENYDNFVILEREPYLPTPPMPLIPDEDDPSAWYENHGQGD
jgi:hypothetical protein